MYAWYDIDEIEERRLCAACIGEEFLRGEVERLGAPGPCSYCESVGTTLLISEISKYVDTAFEQHFWRTSDEPSSFEYTSMNAGGRDWERKGELAVYAIADAAKIDEKAAGDVRWALKHRHWNRGMEEVGEELPFDEESCYAARKPDDIEFREQWRNFENNLKTEARFFGTAAKATLDDIFEGLGGCRGLGGRRIIVQAGPGRDPSSLYRARVFQAPEEFEEALRRPNVHIGPPPPKVAKAGRMNAHGIAVFYGATNPQVASSEVRPPVGSRVIVGEFELLRDLRLLDLAALRSVLVEGSVFDPGYIRQLERARFLKRLRDRFIQPVMPNDEPLEYLATQVVADYLASHSKPSLDGIVYPSVQDGTNGRNVVLFHKSSRVASMDVPEGTEIRLTTGHNTEEGWETEYVVREKPPSTGPTADVEQDWGEASEAVSRPLRPFEVGEDSDQREISLRLKEDCLSVHHIEAARYDIEDHSVRWHRTE